MAQYPPNWQPPKHEKWSIPPVITDDAVGTDNAIRLRQGIICEVKLDSIFRFQNINENEDDLIEFSYHGDKDGIWGKMVIGTTLVASRPLYFLNRTHKDVLYLSTF